MALKGTVLREFLSSIKLRYKDHGYPQLMMQKMAYMCVNPQTNHFLWTLTFLILNNIHKILLFAHAIILW